MGQTCASPPIIPLTILQFAPMVFVFNVSYSPDSSNGMSRAVLTESRPFPKRQSSPTIHSGSQNRDQSKGDRHADSFTTNELIHCSSIFVGSAFTCVSYEPCWSDELQHTTVPAGSDLRLAGPGLCFGGGG